MSLTAARQAAVPSTSAIQSPHSACRPNWGWSSSIAAPNAPRAVIRARAWTRRVIASGSASAAKAAACTTLSAQCGAGTSGVGASMAAAIADPIRSVASMSACVDFMRLSTVGAGLMQWPVAAPLGFATLGCFKTHYSDP